MKRTHFNSLYIIWRCIIYTPRGENTTMLLKLNSQCLLDPSHVEIYTDSKTNLTDKSSVRNINI